MALCRPDKLLRRAVEAQPPRNALGRTGTVYLTVPPGRSSPGKVTLTVQEQLTEFEALTDSPAPIPTGSPVRVTGLAGRGALLVEPIPSESEETE